MPDSRALKRLWFYLKPYWGLELATLFVMMVLAGLAVALPMALQYMIDTLIPKLAESASGGKVDLMPVLYFGGFLLGIYILNIIFSLGRDYFAARIGAHIIQDIRFELFSHLERVSLRFYQTNQVGEIMSRMLSDVSRIQALLTTTLLTLIANILLLTAILIYLLNVNWLLTVVALVPVPLTILLSHKFGKRLHVINKKLQETVAGFSARLQEALSSIRTVIAFGQEDREAHRANNVLTRLTRLYISNSVNTSFAFNFVHFVNMIGPIVVLSWGTYLIAGGSIKLGALIAFYVLLTYLYQPVRDLAAVNVEIQSAMASVNRIFEYLDLPPAITEDPKPVVLKDVRGSIELKNVTFGYPGGEFRMEDLSLNIQPGEKVAVVGHSGSGKTTLINLIMRFFDPESGSITLDGVDIRRLRVRNLRRQIGLVDQDPVLFRASLFHNIAYADADATQEEVERATRIANIHQFIMEQSRGYETEVGERGVTLSGGERQRLCLARAILKSPPILILDEATSALDSHAEKLIQEALKRALEGKTAVIIAHRLSTVRHADRIVVIDRGRIRDSGSHESLLDSCDLYRELASGQSLG